jgi:hypothetical protein
MKGKGKESDNGGVAIDISLSSSLVLHPSEAPPIEGI